MLLDSFGRAWSRLEWEATGPRRPPRVYLVVVLPALLGAMTMTMAVGVALSLLLSSPWASLSPGSWALPGGTLEPGESLEQSIRRHLATRVDVRELSHLEQLETRSNPERNPGRWELATAYLGLIPRDTDPSLPDDTSWHRVGRTPRPRL